MTVSIHHAEALAWLREQPGDTFDAFFADPPYGMSPDGRTRTWDEIEAMRDGKARRGFMGRAWDAGVPGVTFWREVLRVLKPGAPILAFGGTRGYHRMTCALEDAGAEIVDCLSWLYGQGFPKSYDVSKGIDAAAGATREIVGQGAFASRRPNGIGASVAHGEYGTTPGHTLTAPATPAARAWSGYGTALRPSWEPCVLACKPFDGTIAANALKHGVGGLWIDGCRLPRDYAERSESWKRSGHSAKPDAAKIAAPPGSGITLNAGGGWPSNVTIDEDVAAMLDEQSGTSRSTGGVNGGGLGNRVFGKFANETPSASAGGYGDAGGASRFLYVAKVSRTERELGCEGLPLRTAEEVNGRDEGTAGAKHARAGAAGEGGVRNHHPTLKPIALTEWLAKLILPPARETPRRLLNAFAGSGSEAIGAMRAGWDEIVCVEREAEYVPALRARVARWAEVPAGMSVDDVRASAEAADPRQLAMFGGDR